MTNFKHLDMRRYCRPLVAADSKSGAARFLGNCFFIDDVGTFITCAHVLEKLMPSEVLVSTDHSMRKSVSAAELHRHPSDDFAVGRIPNTKSGDPKLLPVPSLGRDVMTYAYTSSGFKNGSIQMDHRMLKGNVSRINNNPAPHLRSKGVLEVSYSALAGFSGAPVFSIEDSEDGAAVHIVGMLIGNIESSIEVFSHAEVLSDGRSERETIHRITEYGVAHQAKTIVRYLDEYSAAKGGT